MNESTGQGSATNEFIESLRRNFADEDYRYAYVESFQNSYVAAQIKLLREDFPMTQGELAEKIGTKQPGVSRLEDVNYSAWKTETLRKVARALGVRLRITFEEWSTLPDEIENFRKENLVRAPFQRDPMFSPEGYAATLGRVAEQLPPPIPPHSELGSYQPKPSGALAQAGE